MSTETTYQTQTSSATKNCAVPHSFSDPTTWIATYEIVEDNVEPLERGWTGVTRNGHPSSAIFGLDEQSDPAYLDLLMSKRKQAFELKKAFIELANTTIRTKRDIAKQLLKKPQFEGCNVSFRSLDESDAFLSHRPTTEELSIKPEDLEAYIVAGHEVTETRIAEEDLNPNGAGYGSIVPTVFVKDIDPEDGGQEPEFVAGVTEDGRCIMVRNDTSWYYAIKFAVKKTGEARIDGMKSLEDSRKMESGRSQYDKVLRDGWDWKILGPQEFDSLKKRTEDILTTWVEPAQDQQNNFSTHSTLRYRGLKP